MSGRVLIVTPNLDVGGAQETVVNLARQLPRQGWPSLVVSFDDGPLRQDLERDGVDLELLPPRQHPVTALPAFLAEMSRYRTALRRIIDDRGITSVITQGLGTLDFLFLTLGRERPQIWWTIQNARFMLRAEHVAETPWMLRPKREAHRWLYRWGSTKVDGVVAVSDETAQAFIDETKGAPERVSVVYNAVDTDRLPVPAPGVSIRHELGLDCDAHVMTMVGTFKRQKGHEYLITAAAKACPQFPDLHILIAGDGDRRDEMIGLADELHVSRQVHFLGTRRDVPEILAVSDSFVLPSLWEGLSMALMEAMASGLPVIATNVSGSRQAVIDGVTGLLVPPGDSDALAQAIEQLLADTAAAKRMGQAGRTRIEESYSAQAQARHLIELFERSSR